MKTFFISIVAIFFVATIEANSSYFLLGSKTQTYSHIEQNNSIIWNYSKNRWKVSAPKNSLTIDMITPQGSGYILINNDDINYDTPLHATESYLLTKGWNYLHTPKDGIDIAKSFTDNRDISFVYTYDKDSKAWAGYSPNDELRSKMESTRILTLKYIEPNRGFYIYMP